MRISVRLFAGLRERAGTDHVELDLPDDARAVDVLRAMGLEPGQCIVALDREYAEADARVLPSHEVALIPPVSGGAGSVRAEPLDPRVVLAAVRDPRAGAVVLFEGSRATSRRSTMRPTSRWRSRRSSAIIDEEIKRHGLCAAAVLHRVGRVPLSEPSVIVAASRPAPRRGVRRRPGADRPGEGRGADLEGRTDGEDRRRVEGTLPKPSTGARLTGGERFGASTGQAPR